MNINIRLNIPHWTLGMHPGQLVIITEQFLAWFLQETRLGWSLCLAVPLNNCWIHSSAADGTEERCCQSYPGLTAFLERSGWVVEGAWLILPQRERIQQIKHSDLKELLTNKKNVWENQKYSKPKTANRPFLSKGDCVDSPVSGKGFIQCSVLFNPMCRRQTLWQLELMSSDTQIIPCS